MIGAGIATLVALPITLPLVPLSSLHSSGVVDANYDAGETVAWPTYVDEIAAVYPRGATIIASNYGEAGAIDRYGAPRGLPLAYSGDMGFWWWGPPTGRGAVVETVGFDGAYLHQFFRDCSLGARLDNHLDVDNDEQGAPVYTCAGRLGSWATIWPQLKSVGSPATTHRQATACGCTPGAATRAGTR